MKTKHTEKEKKNQTKTPEVDCLVNDAEIFHR